MQHIQCKKLSSINTVSSGYAIFIQECVLGALEGIHLKENRIKIAPNVPGAAYAGGFSGAISMLLHREAQEHRWRLYRLRVWAQPGRWVPVHRAEKSWKWPRHPLAIMDCVGAQPLFVLFRHYVKARYLDFYFYSFFPDNSSILKKTAAKYFQPLHCCSELTQTLPGGSHPRTCINAPVPAQVSW